MPTDQQNNEPELLLRMADGDEAAMQTIFRIYYPRAVFFAFSLVDNMEQSRDMAQDAFIQLWRDRRRFVTRETKNIQAYLYTIIRRDGYDYLRHQKVKRLRQPEIIGGLPVLQESHEADVVYLETLHAIYEEIRKLPPNLSEIVTLSFIDGLTTEEIAARLSITPNNVRVLKSRALSRLKTAILTRKLLSASSLLAFLKNFL